MSVVEEDLELLIRRLNTEGSRLKDRTVLVTGGAGFIGSWICDVVNAFGGRIICVDNLSSGSERNIKNLQGQKNFQLIKTDIQNFSTDEELDYIVHMACIASPPLYQNYPIETLDANVLGTRNVLEIAKRKNLKSLLFASTSEVYGDAAVIPTPEDYWGYVNPIGPRSIYDEGKRVAETYCQSYIQKHNLPIRTGRIFNTYGPRLDAKSISPYGRVVIKFVIQALYKEPVTVYGDGSQTRSFCYITDLIEGLLKLLLQPKLDGEFVNIGNDEEISILDLAKLVINLSGSNSKVIFKPLPQDDPKRRKPDLGKAEKLLGFQPNVTLKEGLMKTINWVYATQLASEISGS